MFTSSSWSPSFCSTAKTVSVAFFFFEKAVVFHFSCFAGPCGGGCACGRFVPSCTRDSLVAWARPLLAKSAVGFPLCFRCLRSCWPAAVWKSRAFWAFREWSIWRGEQDVNQCHLGTVQALAPGFQGYPALLCHLASRPWAILCCVFLFIISLH